MTDGLQFDFDWIDPQGARGEELRATWATLRIQVDGTLVTRILDSRSKTVRDEVFTPIYPLAEWIATNWWQLLYETTRPAPITPAAARHNHSLAQAREGFAYPSLTFEPSSERVRLTWSAERLPHTDIEFLNTGESLVSLPSAEIALRELVSAVVARLEQQGITGTLLQEEWAAVEGSTDEERDFCVSAAALGCAPYSVDDVLRDLIVLVGNDLPRSLRSEFFSASTPSTLEADAHYVRSAIEVAEADRTRTPRLATLREEFQQDSVRGETVSRGWSPSDHPWEQGYAAARSLRRHLGLKTRPLRTVSEIAGVLGAAERQVLRSLPDNHGGFDGLLGFNKLDTPHIVLPRRNAMTTRFQFCRAVFEYLSRDSLSPALLTTATTVAQQRGRAFAAEFLAPAESVRERVSGDPIPSEEVDELAAHFGVSWLVIEHQLANHRIARIAS